MWYGTVGCIVALTLSLLVAPYAVEAQHPTKVYRIGILAGSAQALRERRGYDAWQQGLRELGYVEGQNVILEYRYTEGNVALLPALAADLVRLNVDSSWWVASGTWGSWRLSRRPR
jgi:putative tryptophan/tyrosine transport system substrate-binding protein